MSGRGEEEGEGAAPSDQSASTVHCRTVAHACMRAQPLYQPFSRQRRCPASSPANHCCVWCLSHAPFGS